MWPVTNVLLLVKKEKGFDSRVTWNGNKDSSGEYSAVRAFSAGLSLQF